MYEGCYETSGGTAVLTVQIHTQIWLGDNDLAWTKMPLLLAELPWGDWSLIRWVMMQRSPCHPRPIDSH